MCRRVLHAASVISSTTHRAPCVMRMMPSKFDAIASPGQCEPTAHRRRVPTVALPFDVAPAPQDATFGELRHANASGFTRQA